MRIHDKYVLRQFIKIFVFSVIAFAAVYVVVDLFEELDNFIDKKAPIHLVSLYYFYSLPYIITYVTPVSLLLAAIFSMGVMARRNELTALISSGVSLMRVAAPMIITAFVISVGLIGFNEVVVTRSNRERLNIKHYDIEGRKRQNPLYKENLHYLGEGGIISLASKYTHSDKTLYDAVLQKFENNTLRRRIDAKKCQWDGKEWVFHEGFDRVFEADSEKVTAFDKLVVEGLKETPNDFAKEEIEEENMNVSELREYISKIRKSGGAVEKYLVDLYFKFSFPLAGAIFVLIGVAFTSAKRKQSIATGFGTTLIISFLYYGILRTGRTLGQNGVIPPFLGAEMGNFIFLLVGGILLLRANR